jgi:hypothetical protein
MLIEKIATYERIKHQLEDEISLDDLELLVQYDAELVKAWDALLETRCETSDEKLKLAGFLLDQIDENAESSIILEQIKAKVLELMASMA